MKQFWLIAVAAGVALASERKVSLAELPPAVQAVVKDQTRKATLMGLSTEREKGRTLYEVEMKMNGKSRDILLDQMGVVVETEEEVDMADIPAPAQAAIQKWAQAGTLSKVEKVTSGSRSSYEATVKTKAGKVLEHAVNADGSSRR